MQRLRSTSAFLTVLMASFGLSCGATNSQRSSKSPVHFEHVIIAIQENRTPDNLFSDCGIPGADLQTNGGEMEPLAWTQGDFDHSHAGFLAEAGGSWPNHSNDYVDETTIQPYCELAKTYGFANRMFQTNQGPSFPAHQFLVSGSSAPGNTSDLFVSDNPTSGSNCKSPPTASVPTIAPNGSIGATFPCFPRSSLVDLLVSSGLTWKYYAVSGKTIWDGVSALQAWYRSENDTVPPANLLSDISGGSLASLSWVTPTGACSDHPEDNAGCGPAWIASIVNAVGQSQYWQNTAILVTWDDWGGWYDHVSPESNETSWCDIYCYGFRVPLLVISAYTPPMVDNGTHDFGSIIRFAEDNFSLPLVGPGTFADAYADDLSAFFETQQRAFRSVVSRPLTHEELTDTSDLDDD